MNIGNLGSKETVGVKFKESICTELCLKLWFQSDWYFCNITNSGWFLKATVQKECPNNHFLNSLQKQPYTDVLENRCFSKFRNIHRKTYVFYNRPAPLFKRDFNTDVSLRILRNFYKQPFLQNASGNCFCQFDEVTVQCVCVFIFFQRKCFS